MKVLYAKMETGKEIFHPAFKGSVKGTISPQVYPGIELSLVGDKLQLGYKGRLLLIPFNRFDVVEVEQDITLELPSVKKASK